MDIQRMNRPQAAAYLAWQCGADVFGEAPADELSDIFADDGADYYAVEEAGALIGMLEFEFPNGELALRFALAPAVRGRGLGVALVQQGILFARANNHYAGVVHAVVPAANRRAQQTLARVGFTTVDAAGSLVQMRLVTSH